MDTSPKLSAGHDNLANVDWEKVKAKNVLQETRADIQRYQTADRIIFANGAWHNVSKETVQGFEVEDREGRISYFFSQNEAIWFAGVVEGAIEIEDYLKTED